VQGSIFKKIHRRFVDIGSSSETQTGVTVTDVEGNELGAVADKSHRTAASKIEFPRIFGHSLVDLNLSRNHLRAVPSSVCELFELARLDLSL